MKRLTSAFLAAALLCGPGILLGQQQSPKQSGPPQNKQDVPNQEPGTNNPDLATQRNAAPDTSTNGATSSSSQSHSKKKTKRGKQTSSSSQTQTGSH